MATPTPLDPDQVPCPLCKSPAAVPCRTASGKKARTVHVERRHAANPHDAPQSRHRPPATPLTPEARAAGGRKAGQDRRRRRAEQDAAIAAETERQLRAEAQANAARMAADAVRWAEHRAILKRQTLDAALAASTRLLEGLAGLARPVTDDDGRVQHTAVERADRNGVPRQVEVPDVRGWADADTIERLAKVAASTLNSVRLEEGTPTKIGATTETGDRPLAGVDLTDLLEFARNNLPGTTT